MSLDDETLSTLREQGLSVPVNVRRLPKTGSFHKFKADDSQRDLLAKFADVLEVRSFQAEARVKPWQSGGVSIAGRVEADLVQSCAVTGDPVASRVLEDVDALMVPEGSKLAAPRISQEGEIVLEAEGDDPPETFTGDSVDLADVWLEFFILGIDPYVKAEGAALETGDEDVVEEESPFAALAALKTD